MSYKLAKYLHKEVETRNKVLFGRYFGWLLIIIMHILLVVYVNILLVVYVNILLVVYVNILLVVYMNIDMLKALMKCLYILFVILG